jgi:hypothetical protein
VTDSVDNTGRGLVQFLEYAAEKGLLNRDTAGSMKTASVRILSIDEGWETADLRTLDIDGRPTGSRPSTRTTSPQEPVRLQVAAPQVTRHVPELPRNPSGFRPQVRPTRKPTEKKDTPERKGDQTSGGNGNGTPPPPVDPPPPEPNVRGLPVPVAPGRHRSRLLLPPDLCRAEAQRLGTFIEALAMDDALPRALPAPEKATTGEPTTENEA